MEKYRIQSTEQLTPELILSLVERFKLKEVPRLQRLYRYFENKSDIKQRVMVDQSKPNHRLATPFANYITSTILGYFLGKPVSYQSNNDTLMLSLQSVLDGNEEQNHNAKLGLHQSVYGIGYELVYLNENRELKFSVLNAEETFMIYDTSINAKPLAAIRFYEIQDYSTEASEMHVEVYTKDSITHYKNVAGKFKAFNEETHYFKHVPVIPYENSEDRFGDYERVIDLINAFDLTISDQQNSLDYFSDAYLLITGMSVEAEDVAKMKENRVIVAGEGGAASFLTKTTDLGIKGYQDTLQDNIHTFSFVPDMSDEKFSNASGESLKYKLLGLENAVSIKERSFKQALEQRIKLIVNYFNLKGQSFNHTDVVMTFTRNMPQNNSDVAEMITKLKGLVSDATLISQLPFIEDVNYELQLLDQQKNDSINSMGTFEIAPITNNTNEDVE